MAVGLYAGSFDPVHRGHLALIETASSKLDRLAVVVATNGQKPTAMFAAEERVRMLSECCRDLSNVLVVADGSLLIDMARRVGASVLVRGAGKEHVTEREMAYLNGCEGLPTLLIPSDPPTAFISSSLIRALVATGALDAAANLVPASVADLIKARHAARVADLT